MPGYDCGIKRAEDKGVWAEQLEQDNWDRQQGQDSGDGTAGTGELVRTAGIEQLGPNSQAKTAST